MIALAGCDTLLGFELPAVADAGAGGDAPDADDGCWDRTLMGDEDGDGQPDGCDLCPADPEGDPSNGDGDEMNDACDPDPDTSQELVAFDGFAAKGTWEVVSGTWRIDTDRFLQTDIVADGAAFWRITPTDRVGIDVLFDGLTGTPGTGAEVWMALGAAGVNVRCGLQYGGAPTPDRLVLDVDGSQIGVTDLDAPGVVRIQLYQAATGQVRCTGRRGTAGPVTLVTSPGSQTSTLIGVATTLSTAAFRSVTVFSTP